MSELAQLTGATSSADDVLPGYILSPWSLTEISEAEQEFEQQHLRTTAAGAATAMPSVRDAMLEEAQKCIVWGYFLYGAPGFWAKTAAMHELPFILWLTLRGKQQQITREAAKTLVTPENYRQVQAAVRKCAGWKAPPAPKAPDPNEQGAGSTTGNAPAFESHPSPGETSTASSPPAA